MLRLSTAFLSIFYVVNALAGAPAPGPTSLPMPTSVPMPTPSVLPMPTASVGALPTMLPLGNTTEVVNLGIESLLPTDAPDQLLVKDREAEVKVCAQDCQWVKIMGAAISQLPMNLSSPYWHTYWNARFPGLQFTVGDPDTHPMPPTFITSKYNALAKFKVRAEGACFHNLPTEQTGKRFSADYFDFISWNGNVLKINEQTDAWLLSKICQSPNVGRITALYNLDTNASSPPSNATVTYSNQAMHRVRISTGNVEDSANFTFKVRVRETASVATTAYSSTSPIPETAAGIAVPLGAADIALVTIGLGVGDGYQMRLVSDTGPQNLPILQKRISGAVPVVITPEQYFDLESSAMAIGVILPPNASQNPNELSFRIDIRKKP